MEAAKNGNFGSREQGIMVVDNYAKNYLRLPKNGFCMNGRRNCNTIRLCFTLLPTYMYYMYY